MDLGKKYARLFEGKHRSNDKALLNKVINEANEIPTAENIISDAMAEVNGMIDRLYDLEQDVMTSIEMYQEETGDLRFDQLLNQGARYIQSANSNLEHLHKMLKRNL